MPTAVPSRANSSATMPASSHMRGWIRWAPFPTLLGVVGGLASLGVHAYRESTSSKAQAYAAAREREGPDWMPDWVKSVVHWGIVYGIGQFVGDIGAIALRNIKGVREHPIVRRMAGVPDGLANALQTGLDIVTLADLLMIFTG